MAKGGEGDLGMDRHTLNLDDVIEKLYLLISDSTKSITSTVEWDMNPSDMYSHS